MRVYFGLGVAIVIGMLIGVASVRADDEKEETIALDKVPKAVMNAVKAKFPGAKIEKAAKEEEDGKTFYEVSLEFKDDDYDVLVKPDGTIVEIEKEIEVKDLPAAVTAALKAKYPGAKLKGAEELTKGTTVSYEVIVVTADKKEREVALDKDGKITKVGEAEKEDKD